MQLPAAAPTVRSAPAILRTTSRGEIIGSDARLAEVIDTMDRVARSSCTVLVTGESGTGKELVVAALHDASPRSANALVTINCGAIPSELVESELFGYAKGSFTGATGAKRGLVAAAEGGTLFLDEVGELPLAVQVKLLRLLQQREYTPIGETKAVKCDVRIVAATHRNLESEVKAGRFREDLYYRLNVIHVELPPLRERRGDLVMLARHFCAILAERSGRDDIRGLSGAALEAIEQDDWPGNVRALENAIERGVLLARGPLVEIDDLFPRRRTSARERTTFKAEDVSGILPVLVDATETAIAQVEAAPHIPPTQKSEIEAELRAMLPNSAPIVGQMIIERTHDAPELDTTGVNVESGSTVRRGSNPLFPRQLPDLGMQLFNAVESYQTNLIKQALARTDGNKNRAAQLLGVNRTTLVEMIRRRKL